MAGYPTAEIRGVTVDGASVIIRVNEDGQLVLSPDPIAVEGGLTDTELRATPVPVSGPLTDAALRATPVPVSGTVALSAPISVAQLVVVSDEFTRPNTNTQYTSSDEVSNNATQVSAVPLHFVNVVANVGDTGYVVKAVLNIGNKATTNAVFRLRLFNAVPVMVGDNLPWTLLQAVRAERQGYVDFALVTEDTANSNAAEGLDDGLRLPFKCGVASKDMWGIIIAKAGYTPTGLEVVTVTLTVELA